MWYYNNKDGNSGCLRLLFEDVMLLSPSILADDMIDHPFCPSLKDRWTTFVIISSFSAIAVDIASLRPFSLRRAQGDPGRPAL